MGIWFSSDANITDRNLAKFITLLPASNVTPLGGKLLSFVTQSSLSLQGSPVENADKNSCSAFIGATWRRGPTFYWGFQEPLRENFEGAFQCNLCCNPRHHLEGQSQHRCCAGTGRLPQHASHAVSAPSTLAGPCTTHGRWSHSQGCPVRRACLGAPSSGSPCAALQGRLQARPQSYRHQHWQLGIACRGSWLLASSCAFRSQEERGEEKQTAGRDKSKEKTETDSQPGNAIHLQQLRQRLSRQDWVGQPLQTLLRTRLRTNQGAHHCLSRQTDAYYFERADHHELFEPV